MGWLKKVPKISFLLLVATYSVFGWLYGSWTVKLALEEELWAEWVRASTALIIAYLLGLLFITTITLFFTSPMTLFTFGMENWFRVDAKAFCAIAISILIFALIIEYPAILTRFLILSAAAMLFRIDLQTVGCSRKIARLFLMFFGIVAFTLGLLGFYIYSV